MKNPFSNDQQYLAQLQNIEQQINQNQLQEAARQLNLLAKKNAHDPRLFLLGSRLAEVSRNREGTLQAAREAHRRAPQWPVATIHLAGVLANRGEAEEAMSLAQQALQQSGFPAIDQVELLTRAASVAQSLDLYPQALQWLRQADQIRPADVLIRRQIARSLTECDDAAAAIDILTELLGQLPNNPILLIDRLRASLGALQTQQAVQDGEALMALDADNEVYRFYFDIARAKTPKFQPASLVSEFFDDVSARYDRHWAGPSRRQLSTEVAQMINQWHPDRKGDVLDLGCGTGLLGASLGPMEGVLVGVDLSAGMIEQAARHGVYDRFHQVNLLDALQATPENLYHVITALDVFAYVGSLDAAIADAYRILLPGGRFVFSFETGARADADYALQSSYRYNHQRSYVLRLLGQAGFEDIAAQDRVPSLEADQPVQRLLVTASRPYTNGNNPKIGVKA